MSPRAYSMEKRQAAAAEQELDARRKGQDAEVERLIRLIAE